MQHLERPKLRGLDVRHIVHQGQPMLQLMNRQGLSEMYLQVPAALGLVLQFFDGKRTIEEIVKQVHEDTSIRIAADMVVSLTRELDAVCLLESPTYDAALKNAVQEYRRAGVRQPACAGGAYRADPVPLREQLHGIFEHPNGAGHPTEFGTKDNLRGIFAPHIDFHRGGPSFGWAFRELAERSRADVFVIVATSHYSPERFTLTRNDFATPLGTVRTNRPYVDALAESFGTEAVYRDELAHIPEHSIEFEVLLLQYLLAEHRSFSIVPLLVGSMQDAVDDNTQPTELGDVARMIDSLRDLEAQSKANVCYVISGDLAHIGPKFGDEWKIDQDKARWNRTTDAALLRTMELARHDVLFEFIAGEGDERRICGFPPTYVMFAAATPNQGTLHYHDQYVDPKGNEIVSFASLSFDK
jgi:hypothetical protein